MTGSPDGAGAQAHGSEPSWVATADGREQVRKLPALLRARYPELQHSDVLDVTHDAVTRYVERERRGLTRNVDVPGAYLTAIGWNLARDRLRSTRRRAEPHADMTEFELTDEEAAHAFERSASAADVRQVVARIAADRDATLFHVVTHMLDEIARTGQTPSNRQIARDCGLSHTGVAKALVRLRPYFRDLHT